MRGTYVFKEAGEIVSVSENLITTQGRREILRFLAGQRGALGGSIGVGAGQKPVALVDTDLDLEFEKARVNLAAPNYGDGLVVYKGVLAEPTIGTIYECGLWSSNLIEAAPRNILSFDSRFETWGGGAWSPLNSRLGVESYLVSVATNTSVSATISDFGQDISGYSTTDQFVLSFYVNDGNTDTVTVRFEAEAAANRYEFVITGVTEGYNVRRFTKNDLVKYGTVEYNQVLRVVLITNSKTTDSSRNSELPPLGYTGTRVFFDKMSVRTRNLEMNNNTLISRTVLSAPLQKRAGIAMDIEYYLRLNI